MSEQGVLARPKLRGAPTVRPHTFGGFFVVKTAFISHFCRIFGCFLGRASHFGENRDLGVFINSKRLVFLCTGVLPIVTISNHESTEEIRVDGQKVKDGSISMRLNSWKLTIRRSHFQRGDFIRVSALCW
jgi:hypothetical protein